MTFARICLIVRRFGAESSASRESRAIWAQLRYFAARDLEVSVFCEEREAGIVPPGRARVAMASYGALTRPLEGYTHSTDLQRNFARHDLYVLHYRTHFSLADIARELPGGRLLFAYHGGERTPADLLGASLVQHAHLALAEDEPLREELCTRLAFPAARTRVCALPWDDAAAPAGSAGIVDEIDAPGEAAHAQVLRAHAAGRPVLCPDRDGLHAAVGRGGVLYEPEMEGSRTRAWARLSGSAGEGLWPANRKLRIVVAAPRAGREILGGAEAHLAMLARELQALGHDVELVATQARSHTAWQNELPPEEVWDGLTIRRFPLDPFDRQRHDERSARVFFQRPEHRDEGAEAMLQGFARSSALTEYLRGRAERTDLILVGPYLHAFTVEIARALPERCVVMPCIHDEWLARLRIYREMLRSVRGIMFNTPEEMAFAAETLRVRNPRSMVVGYGLDPEECRGRAPADVTGRGRPYILYAGRVEANKNLGELVDGFLAFKRRHPDAKLDLAVAGSGPYELPAREDILPLGYLTRAQLLDAFANAALFCLPSLYESFSIVIMEAWLQGAPVAVHAGCAVTRAHVERSGGGWTFSNAGELADLLARLSDGPADARERGAKGRAYVLAEHAAERVRERLARALTLYGRPLAEVAREAAEARRQERSGARYQTRMDRLLAELEDLGAGELHERDALARAERALRTLSLEAGGWPRPALSWKQRVLHALRDTWAGRALTGHPALFAFMRRVYRKWET
ncbi:MAG: glycosyltransferase family 4 protein [Planctomycetota bacterium]|nr:glycosyltransferase family 4 protein [Planctomycetota bacterium]